MSDECKTELGRWFKAAKEHGWNGLDEIYRYAVHVHGPIDVANPCGFWYCAFCNQPVIDPAILNGDDGTAVLLTDASGIGATILCHVCYDAANEARAKIKVCDDDECIYEDDSALTDDERQLASLLDDADAGIARQSRDLIRGYPRNECGQLHRYQDDIDAARRRAGKNVVR
jgi:hypothetical protein